MQILPITLLSLLLLLSTQSHPLNFPRILTSQLTTTQYKIHPYLIECKQIEHTDNDYLCVEKQYEWVLEDIDVEYEEDLGLEVEVEGGDEVRERVRAVLGDLFFVVAKVEHQRVGVSYLGVQEDPIGTFKFVPTPIPDRIKVYQQQLPQILHDQIDRQFADKRSHLFMQAIILIIILLILIGLAYYWRRSTLSSKIDVQPADLKEAMMAKIAIQEEQNRKQSSGFVRASQPPPKIKTSGTGM